MHQWVDAGVGVVSAIIGLAIFSVLVSPRAQSASVIGALSSGLANDISAATAPVTGNAATPVVSSGGFGGLNMGGFTVPSFTNA